MTLSWRARLRRLRFVLLAGVASIVILLGVLAGLTQLAMPWLQRHPQQVERWLSARLERPVQIGQLGGGWVGSGLRLALNDVEIGARNGERALRIAHAELAFNLFALVQRNSALTEFRVAGLDLRLVRSDADGWQLHGLELGASAPPSEPFSLGALGAVEISDLGLTIDDPRHDLHVALRVPVLRLLNRGAVTRVLGRVRREGSSSPPLDLVADLDPATQSGDLYVGGREVDLAQYAAAQSAFGLRLAGGQGTIELWARMHAAQIDDVRARVDLAEARFDALAPIAVDPATAVAPRVGFDRLAFAARWLRGSAGWTLDLADVVVGEADSAPARLTVERGGDGEAHWRAGASALSLEPLGALAMLATDVPDGLRRWLYLAHPRGLLQRATLAWNGAHDYELGGALRGLELASAQVVPGVEHLDLEFVGDAQALLLHLPQQALRVDYPHVFRRPFHFARFGGDVTARREGGGWRLATDRVGFEGEGYGGELRGSVDVVGGRPPFVDLYAAVTHAEVVAAKRFWPTNVMPPPALEWLDRGLVGGEVVGGRAALRGDLAEWPFHGLGGRMIARAEIADLTLDYDPAWPRASKLRTVATFINDGMQAEVEAGESMGVRIGSAHATIADFGAPVLDLAVKGEGSGAHLLDFLRATPIGQRYKDPLKDLAVGGKGQVALALNLPIHATDTLSLDGSVDLGAAKLDQNAYDLHFTNASGKLRFNQKGFAADALDVGFRGGQAKLALAIGGEVADPAHVFEASLRGRFPASAVFADVPALLPLLAPVAGESEWTARVDIGDDGHAQLALDSDLAGTAIGLPAPLDKNAEAALPFHLELGLPYAGQAFRVRLGDLAAVTGRLPGGGHEFAARIDFGSASAGPLPAAGMVIGGHVAVLDAGAWSDRVMRGSGGSGEVVRRIDLRADTLLLASRRFDDMQLAIDNGAAQTTIRLDGAALAGSVEIPRADLAAPGIRARFARFYWPEPAPEAADASAFADVAPASLPPLHLAIDDFRLGKASFGSAQFDSEPTAHGMRVDRLETHSPNLTLTASGDWTGNAKDNRSKLAIVLTAPNLGHMMDALGFPGLIDGGATKATIDASWAGPPSAFALPRLDGTLDIRVGEGRIPDVEPGPGRIFGLLSLGEIPRRLSLDFSDLFKSGFAFNSIDGSFRLADGDAWTDGLTIKGPAADIVVTGRTGLRSRDYDQQMDVTPHAGTTLPVVGAIAAGPVGAAAGLVVQGILNKPLGRAVERRYLVTGSWDKPKITTEKTGGTIESTGKKKAPGRRG